MPAIFWLSVGAILYVYLGYPLAVWLLSRSRPVNEPTDPDAWPTVTLIIAAYNEENVIGAKLENALRLDYPPAQLEILVASDGSTDRTDAIAREFQAHGVRLLRVEGRQGKTAAQNAAAAQARGDILVFSDANAFYEPDALHELVRHFARADVGCVEGRRVDATPSASATGRHELAYRDWESRIKTWESRLSSCTGATGPIYAVRRALYIPLPPAMISDLMEPMLIVREHRKRHIFAPAARSHEIVLGNMRDEFRRKIRIVTRCLNSLRLRPDVLNPFRTGWFAVQVVSHRLLRWLVPVFAAVAFAANLPLASRPLYRLTLLLQLAFLASAGAGAALNRLALGPALLRLPYFFCAANLAAFIGLLNCLRGRSVVVWQPQRDEQPSGRRPTANTSAQDRA